MNIIKFFLENNTIYCKISGDWESYMKPVKEKVKNAGYYWDGDKKIWYRVLKKDEYEMNKATVQTDYEYFIKNISNFDRQDFKTIAGELKKMEDKPKIEMELDPYLKTILMPHQVESVVRFLNQDNKVLLAHEMGCLDGGTMVTIGKKDDMSVTKKISIKDLFAYYQRNQHKVELNILSCDWGYGDFQMYRIEDVMYSGKKETIKVVLTDGNSLVCTKDHKIYTDRGWVEAQNLKQYKQIKKCDKVYVGFDTFMKVMLIEENGLRNTYDISVPESNCFVANGILVHNSGKTLSALATVYQTKKKCLIIVPKSVQIQWKEEICKWKLADEHKVFILDGNKSDILHHLSNGDYSHYILNYEKLRFFHAPEKVADKKNWSEYEKSLSDIFTAWNKKDFILIYDEMYKIKNHTSQLNKAHKKFRNQDWYGVIGLSGTPMENNLWDFYNTINMINPNTITYADMQKYFVLQTGYTTVFRNFDLFHRLVKNLMYRVTKAEIKKDLPKLVQEYRFVEASAQMKSVKNQLLGNANSVFEIYSTLRVMDSYILDDGSNKFFGGLKEIEHTSKFEELGAILDEIGNNKVLIFTNYEKTAKWLKKKLVDLNYKADYVSSDVKDKESIKKKFVEGDLQICIATSCWERGVDLPTIDFLIQWDLAPNPANYAQRTNRIYRINSENPKTVITLISDIIEGDVYQIIKRKIIGIEKTVEGNFTDHDIMKALSEKWGLPVRKEKDDASV